jgi:hypothetical protein
MVAVVPILPITRVLGIASVATAVPSAIAAANSDFWLLLDSRAMRQTGTRWQLGTEAPHGPAHGSQPGAQAGRHALEGQRTNEMVLTGVTDLRLQNGSRWQQVAVFGKVSAPSRRERRVRQRIL